VYRVELVWRERGGVGKGVFMLCLYGTYGDIGR